MGSLQIIGDHFVEVNQDIVETWRFAVFVGVLQMSYLDQAQRNFVVECSQETVFFLVEGYVDIGFLKNHEKSVGTIEVDVKGGDENGNVWCGIVVDSWIRELDRARR